MTPFRKLIPCLLLLALLLTGCTGRETATGSPPGLEAGGTAPDNAGTSGESPSGTDAASDAGGPGADAGKPAAGEDAGEQAAGEADASVDSPEVEDERLIEQIRAYLLAQAGISDPYLRVFYVDLAAVPAGYDQMAAAVTDEMFYLIAVGADELRLLGQAADTHINMAKLWVRHDRSHIYVGSQLPFRATTLNSTLSWDGQTLTLVEQTMEDPSYTYFSRQEALVAAGDLEGLIRLSESESPLYPGFYAQYYAVPKPILLLAYEQALARYRNGDLPGALRYIKYGIEQYEMVYDDLLEGPLYTAHEAFGEEPLSLDERIPIANDYAFFLAESGDDAAAEAILRKVIQLAPDRVVAYLNLGDAVWNQGRQDEARTYYRKYLELLGENRSIAPPRVLDRLTSA